ncbi:MAG TPA: YdcF family protein [Bryobacteraceae bacterium]
MTEAILIPGGGVRDHDILPSWTQRRLDRAVELYSGQYIITLSAGTTHRPPPVDGYGFPIHESVAAAKYLMEAGVPADRILTETCSYDTIGNAYFARVIHTDPQRLRGLHIITSDFHLARTQAIFEWVFGLDSEAPYQLSFEAVEDSDMPPALLADRQHRELQSLQALQKLAPTINSLEGLHRWLFTHHAAYSSTRGAFREPRVAPLTRQSY